MISPSLLFAFCLGLTAGAVLIDRRVRNRDREIAIHALQWRYGYHGGHEAWTGGWTIRAVELVLPDRAIVTYRRWVPGTWTRQTKTQEVVFDLMWHAELHYLLAANGGPSFRVAYQCDRAETRRIAHREANLRTSR